MRQIRTEIVINADPKAVWIVLTRFSDFEEWNPFIKRVEGEAVLGARLSVAIQPPGKKQMNFKPTITALEPQIRLSWLGMMGLPGIFDGDHIFELHAAEDGTTRFIHREQFKGLLVPLLWNSFAGATKKGFEKMNNALKERAENLSLDEVDSLDAEAEPIAHKRYSLYGNQ